MNRSLIRIPSWKIFISILAFIAVICSGLSFLLIPSLSIYAPFVIVGCIAVIVAVLVGFTEPALFTYITLFVILLPTELIPASINSQLNRLITVLAFFYWLINAFSKKRKFSLSISSAFMICFLFWSAISLTWASHFSDGLTTLQVYGLRMIVFLLVIPNVIVTKRDLRRLMQVLVVSGILLLIVSLQTVLQGYSPGTRLQVLDVNENALGLSFLVSVFAAIWLVKESPQEHRMIKNILVAVFLLASVAMTGLSGSRGSAISWGIALLVMLFFKPTRGWAIFSLLAIAITGLFAPAVFSTTINRFFGVQGDTALGGREYIWPAAWSLIKDHIFVGVGIGNSLFSVVPYLIRTGAKYVVTSGEPMHNPVLTIWSETGIIGLILYLGVLASALLSFIKQWQKSTFLAKGSLESYYPLILAVTGGFLSSWIKGGGMEISFTYFLMISLLLIPSVLNNQLNSENPPDEKQEI